MRSSSEQEEANQKHDASGGTESEQEAVAGSETFYGNLQTFTRALFANISLNEP